MEGLYEYDKNTCSSSTSAPSSSSPSDEISLFLHQFLLHSSSSASSSSPLMPPLGKYAESSVLCSSKNMLENPHLPSKSLLAQDGVDHSNGVSGIFLSSSETCNKKGNSATYVSSSSVAVNENQTDGYDYESEEGVEALVEEVPAKLNPHRSSSKRSRAAEVHNLSEKRRRSRINAKMKALQSLIPNSNKTDKASMLDEAIEYLKQLQLQVQMLSMKNGLSLHPMCLPGALQPIQLSQMKKNIGDENRSPPLNLTGTLPLHQENPLHEVYSLPRKRTASTQPSLPSLSCIINSETFGLDSPVQAQIMQHQQLNTNNLDTNAFALGSGALATTSLSFDAQMSDLRDSGSLETCIRGRDHSGVVLRNLEHGLMLNSRLSR